MSKIMVDEMPKTPGECPFCDDGGMGFWCKFCGDMCNSTDTCPFLMAPSAPDPDDWILTPHDYQVACLRTESVAPDLGNNQYARILQGLMGLNGEAGECIDILKKVLFQGHDLDKERLAGELGDVAWYLAVSADAIGYDLETIFKKNIEKLNKRYPNGFDAEKSVHRSEGDV